jgi:hypothetical protein
MKTQTTKRKRYSSSRKLGRAWLDRKITTEVIGGRIGGYKLVADADTVWNGEKNMVLVRRHKHLPLIVAIRPGVASLGKSALEAVKLSICIPEVGKYVMEGGTYARRIISPKVVPVPYTYVDNLEDDALSSCHLATLQPLVLASSKPILERIIKAFKSTKPSHYGYKQLETRWESERVTLQAVGLDIPKEYKEKKLVAQATCRLTSNAHN